MSGPSTGPRFEVLDTAELGERAASLVAAGLRDAVARRGRATLAVSGGSTPGPMFDALTVADVPWSSVVVLQVDERIAPDGHPERNLTDLRERLLSRVALPAGDVHPVPATLDAEEAASTYAATLREVAGSPPVVDVVHLGLGADGHTASLVPGDGALDVRDEPTAATGPYQGRRRVTLTVPVLRSAGLQLWLVSGDKAQAVERLRAGDPTIPATHVLTDDAIVLLDRIAAGG